MASPNKGLRKSARKCLHQRCRPDPDRFMGAICSGCGIRGKFVSFSPSLVEWEYDKVI